MFVPTLKSCYIEAMPTTIQFLGAAGDVTGSSYLLTTDSAKFLVDCGLFQGSRDNEKHNYDDFVFNPKQVDFMILTHAHLDHCGLIPKLYRHGFRGPIYATPATKELAQLILTDAAQIQENGVNEHQLDILFSKKDAMGALELFQTVEYNKSFSPASGIKFKFQDAGHILGSAMIELWIGKKKVVFSGDIGNCPVPIMNDPSLIQEADYVLCESTYGDRLHSSSNKRDSELLKIIRHGKKHHGKIIIPSFALERSQDLLYALNNMSNAGQLPHIDIYLDSPLAIKITEIYKKYTKLFDKEFQRLLKSDSDLFNFPRFQYTLTSKESMVLNDLEGPAVYIAGSGMADAGRVQHHLLHHIANPSTQLIFVGFQAPGTTGRKIIDGAKRIQVNGHWIPVRGQIWSIDSFSAHADQKGLMRWLAGFNTKPTVFFTHGEEQSRAVLAEKVNKQLKYPVHKPRMFEVFEL